MRWYFAIDEAGGLGETGDLARLAVRSARAVGGLEPVLLYYGGKTEFTAWMAAHDVHIIETAPTFLELMERAQAAGTYRWHSIGHWLRVMVPLLEQEQEFVLYTDCDVIFLRRPDLSAWRPQVFAAAPEFRRDEWRYCNAGVMLMNVPAMRASYPALEDILRYRIGSPGFFTYDDQAAFNEAYKGLWDRLDPKFNWKPYWPVNRDAAILHFHGPKPENVAAIAQARWHHRDDTAVQFEKMLKSRLDCYLGWCRGLGDWLQDVDFPSALRFAGIASALTQYRQGRPPGPDPDLAEFNLFSDQN
jgi:hypothetical protein